MVNGPDGPRIIETSVQSDDFPETPRTALFPESEKAGICNFSGQNAPPLSPGARRLIEAACLSSATPPETATASDFWNEVEAALLPDGASAVKPKKRWRKVEDETALSNDFSCADCTGPDGPRWIVSPDGTEYYYRFRRWESSDGDVKTRYQILSVKNPKYVVVKRYRPNLYKVTEFPDIPDVLTLAGALDGLPPKKRKAREEIPDDERWITNLIRAKNVIEEYALCNDWDYFATLTIDGDKLSRADLDTFRKKLVQMVRDLRRHDGTEIQYLLVPELHPVALKDGRTEWHLHGLLKIPENYLVPFENRRIYGKDSNKFPPKYIREKILKGEPVYYWKQYAKSFGYSVLEPVRNVDASARYLMKYVAKGQKETAQHLEKGQNLYYHSTGLKKAEKIAPDLAQQIRGRAVDGFAKFCETCVVHWYTLPDNTIIESPDCQG